MSTSDRTSILRQIADIEEQLASLHEQQEEAEARLRSLRTQLERGEAASRSKEERSDQALALAAKNLTPAEKVSLFLRLFRAIGSIFDSADTSSVSR